MMSFRKNKRKNPTDFLSQKSMDFICIFSAKRP